MASTENPVRVLQEWAATQRLNQASLNAEGTELSLNGVTLAANLKHPITHGEKSCEYTLASIFLQILNPAQGLKDYREACKKHQVSDRVKPSDKATVVSFFLGAQASEASGVQQAPAAVVPPAPPAAAAPPAVAAVPPSNEAAPSAPPGSADKKSQRPSSSDKHRQQKDRHRSSSRDKHRSDKKRSHSSSRRHESAEKKKKAPKTINTETLFSNLITVVDKRGAKKSEEEEKETAQLVSALSTEGFGVTPELLAEYQEPSRAIVAQEIPVGNSASILKAAAGKDLSRILKLYMEVMQPSKSGSKSSSSSSSKALGSKKTWRTYLVGKKPIIIVPKGMTAPITLLNAHEFFGNSTFVPRDIMMKRGVNKSNLKTTFQRKVGPRLGGGNVEYEIIDNPRNKLPTAKDWDRVVAVVCMGQAWQFKDWPGHYSNPVRLFGSVFGFYAGMEGAKIPDDLAAWAVTKTKLNRDRRGLDSVTYASFWNGLDEFMAIHKPELLPQPDV